MVFWDTSRLKGSAQQLAYGEWDAGSLWHAKAAQWIKLLPVGNCDAMSMEVNVLEFQGTAGFCCDGSNEDYKDWDVGGLSWVH